MLLIFARRCRRRLSSFFRAVLATAVATGFSRAQEPEKTPAKPLQVEQLADGTVKIGGVTLDKKTGTITFPGSINMDSGEMEYLLVQKGGKTHESLLVTNVQPYHIHVAMLLLGAKIPPQAPGPPPPDAIDANYLKNAPKPKGPDVLILVRWQQDGKTVEVPAEDMMFDDAAKKPMSRGPWIYNGSMINQGVFLAQQDRSIASLVIDPSALINNERPDSDNDQVWTVITEKTPKPGTPVEISIQLQPDVSQTKSDPPKP